MLNRQLNLKTHMYLDQPKCQEFKYIFTYIVYVHNLIYMCIPCV